MQEKEEEVEINKRWDSIWERQVLFDSCVSQTE